MACAGSGTLDCAASGSDDPTKHTTSPIVTGTSVLAVKYAGGVMLATDTLGSYGSLARFTDVRRVQQAGKSTLVAGDGDYSDWQYIGKIINELELEDKCVADDVTYTPQQIWSCLTRILYHRRSQFNPLWNNLVVAGVEDGEVFLGTTDKIGTSYKADFVATGLGMHMALPVLRKEWRADMTEDAARALLEDCLRVLFYRDCRTINRITFAKADASGIKIEEPRKIDTEWSYRSFVDPSR